MSGADLAKSWLHTTKTLYTGAVFLFVPVSDAQRGERRRVLVRVGLPCDCTLKGADPETVEASSNPIIDLMRLNKRCTF
jgi:hypothetical protein